MEFITLLRTFLTTRDYFVLSGLSVLSCVVSLLETACLSALMPFLALALSGVGSQKNVVLLGIGLVGLFIVRALLSALLTHWTHQYSQGQFYRIACRTFQNYLACAYRDYLTWNSSAISKMVTNDSFHVGLVVSSLLQLLAECFVVLFMYGVLIWANWKITIGGSLIFGGILLACIHPLLKSASYYGEQKGFFWPLMHRTFSEGFHNFKMVRLLQVEQLLIDRFSYASRGISQAYANYFTVQSFPRLVLETLVPVIVIVCAVMIPTYMASLSIYAVALYRLVPAVNRMISHYGQMKFSLSVIGEYEQKILESSARDGRQAEPISFERTIELRNVSFAYDRAHLVIKGVDLIITKGQRIALIGKSGAGKSTLIDIVMGFHMPTTGALCVDGRILAQPDISSWRQKIGYIPQQIYLFDATIADNVVFGRPYDETRLIQCLKQAQIYDFLLTKSGLLTPVGEGGAHLSGGQKQRIAFARALYGNPDILVLDEATSALDAETESLVLQDLFAIGMNKTLIIVTHRTEMLAHCDNVYEVKEGQIFDVRQLYEQTKTRNFDAPSA